MQISCSGGVTAEAINIFKAGLTQKILEVTKTKNVSAIDSEEFALLTKMCSENVSKLPDETKAHYNKLLQKFLKIIVRITDVSMVNFECNLKLFHR